MPKTDIKSIILRSPLLNKERKNELLASLSVRSQLQQEKLASILLNSESEYFKMYSKAGGNPNAITKFITNKNIYLESFNG